MAEPVERRDGMRQIETRLRVLESGHGHISEQIAELTVEQREQTDRIEAAVERGIEKAVDKLIENLQTKAAEHTGRWLWGTLKAAVTRWLVIGLIVLLTYKYLGGGAAGSLLDSLTGGKK